MKKGKSPQKTARKTIFNIFSTYKITRFLKKNCRLFFKTLIGGMLTDVTHVGHSIIMELGEYKKGIYTHFF